MRRKAEMGKTDLQRDFEGVQFHYDLPPEFFQCFLDRRMVYSCAYFPDPGADLETAQEAKLDLVCRKLDLTPEDHLLDVGCGWGGLLLHAAGRYGCRATGITLSPVQAEYVNTRAEAQRLASQVRAEVVHVLEMPYPAASFSRIATVGAIEHMEDLQRVFERCAAALRPDGRMLVHGMVHPWVLNADAAPGGAAEWVREHIFPVGVMRDLSHVLLRLERSALEIIDVQNITDHYALTLERWTENLQDNLERAAELVGPERARTFLVWLAGCVCGFSENNVLCYQILARRIQPGSVREPLPLRRPDWR